MMLKIIFASRVRDEWVSCFEVLLDASGRRYLARARMMQFSFEGCMSAGGIGVGKPRKSAKSLELREILTPLTTDSKDQPLVSLVAFRLM